MKKKLTKKKSKKDGLTIRQRRFIDYYIALGNATEAAKRAGYSPKTAHSIGEENLKKPEIKAALLKYSESSDNKRIASATEVMEFLTATMRGEIQEEVVAVESVGDFKSEAKIIKKQVTPRDRIEAAKSLAKRYTLTKKEEKDLEIENQRLEIEKQKADKAGKLIDDITAHNQQIQSLASMILNPAPNRNKEDFE